MWYHNPKRRNRSLRYRPFPEQPKRLLEDVPATAANVKEFLPMAVLAMLE